jgi:hypothetical protein
MNTLRRVREYSLLLPRYCIFTVFFSKMPWFTSGTSRKTDFQFSVWNFSQSKVSTRIVHCESFRPFRCFYRKIRIWWKRVFYIAHMYREIRYSCLKIGTTKRSEKIIMNYSRWDLSLCKVSSRKSKVSFPWYSWG